MEIRIDGIANLKQIRSEFAATQAQIESMNHTMQRAAMTPIGGSASRFATVQKAGTEAVRTWNNALAASGAYNVQQLKVNEAVGKHTELLQRQKLGFSQVFGRKSKQMMQAVYRQQLAMNQAVTNFQRGGISDGKVRMSVAVPNQVLDSWDTLNNRVGMFRYRLASASDELINWGKNTQWAGRQLMAGFTYPIAAFGAVSGVLAYQADKSIAQITKVYDFSQEALENSAKMEKEVQGLREQSFSTASELARKYGSDLNGTLEITKELAATGLTGQKLFDTTKEVQRISKLGDIQPEVATKAIVALQTAFRETIKDGDDLADTLNYMNAVANYTSLDLQDVAEAIPRAATGIANLGGTAEEMTVMLVSMREAGIRAPEAANALKSATTRIINPVRKAIDIYKQYGISIEEISKESGGNLYDFLKLLGQRQEDIQGPTEKATQRLRAQGIAALFGTYQNNRLTAALTNMGVALDETDKKGNQTRRAMELMGETSEDMTAMAERSMKTVTESAAGRFQKALAVTKDELRQLGEPFLAVASTFLRVTSSILGFVNGLPDWTKKGLAFAAIFTAMVGPLVMVVGLLGNFIGNLGKFSSFLLKFATSFNIVTESQFASQMAAKAADTAFIKQARSAEILQARLEAVATATNMASNAMLDAAGLRSQGLQMNPAAISNLQQGKVAYQKTSLPGVRDTFGARSFLGGIGGTTSMLPNPYNPQVLYAARSLSEIERSRAHTQTIIGQKALAEQHIREKTKGHIHGGAVAMAAISAAMVTQATTSNETAGSIANMVLMLAIAVPAAKALLPVLAGVSKAAKGAAAAHMASAAATVKGASGVAKTAGAGKTLMSVAKGAAAGFGAMMGPIGWTITGVGLIGYGVYKWWQHQKKIREEAYKSQKVLADTGKNMAEAAGKTAGRYREILITQEKIANQQHINKIAEGAGQFEKGGEQAEAGKEFAALTPSEQQLRAMKMFIDLQVEGKMSVEKATQTMGSLFYATGDSLRLATEKARELRNEIGSLDNVSWSKAIAAAGKEFANEISDFDMMSEWYEDNNRIIAAGGEVGELFSEGFRRAQEMSNPQAGREAAAALISSFRNVVETEWSKVFNDLTKGQKEGLRKLGINSSRELANWYRSDIGAAKMAIADSDMTVEQARPLQQMLENVMNIEKSLANQAGVTMGLGNNIQNIVQLLGNPKVNAFTTSLRDAKIQAQAIHLSFLATQAAVGGFGEGTSTAQQEMATASINAYNVANGLRQGTNPAEALYFLMNGVKEETEKTETAAGKVAKNLRDASGIQFNIKANQIGGIIQEGMSGVQNEIADMITSDFERRMNASIDAVAKNADRQMEALRRRQEAASESMDTRHEREADRLERRQERQDEAFDNRWERRREAIEKKYDTQVKGIEKAIRAEQKAEEIRKRIFEAEQARLDRLTEAANKTIDFNIALQTGELDEAAKIANDMDAAAQSWALSDASEAGSRRSQNRQDRMEGRIDSIEGRKDRALKALEEREEAERKSLERRQEREQKFLEKRQRAEQKHLEKMQDKTERALERRLDAAKEANQKEWENRRDSLDDQLDTFKSFVPKNQKQLEKWMEKMDISYERFGNRTLDPKSEKWGKWFKNSLTDNIRQAGIKIGNDNMWEQTGAKTARKMLRGVGFGSIKKFERFVTTGKLPKDFGDVRRDAKRGGGKKRGGNKGTDNDGSGVRRNPGSGFGPQGILHRGGPVQGGKSSRAGVARTHKGPHSSESLILAKNDEFVVNGDAYKKHGALVEAINSGVYDPGNRTKGIMGGAGYIPGIMGLMSGMIGQMFSYGVGQAMANVASQATAASTYGFVPGKAGMYGDRAFNATQLKNASIIASVGKSMGMSSRDLAIGIMTAITESGLINVNYGDRDSLGLFQQRPSQGWGTPAQVTDPEYASRKFFAALKGVTNRNEMSPWMAAQTVQRSAFSTGSNYREYWDEAQAIFDALRASAGPGGGFVPGPGGRHKPIKARVTSDIHGSGSVSDPYAVDFAVPRGRPVYAVSNGVVTQSKDIRGPLASDRYRGDGPYGSFGRMVQMRTDGGHYALYAHLSRRSVAKGQRVRGGSVLGYTGNTGNSSGPHLHFGATNGPMAWLKNGGNTLSDGLAMLHEGETVLTEPLSQDLKDVVAALGRAGRGIMGGAGDQGWTYISNMRGNVRSWQSADDYGRWSPKGKGRGKKPRTKKPGGKGNSEGGNIGKVPNPGKGGVVRMGTFNVYVGTNKKQTFSDLSKLMGSADILSLQEMLGKVGSTRNWLNKRGWGLFDGGGFGKYAKDNAIAWNKSKYNFLRGGTRKLGDLTGDFVGGRAKRYAKYGLFKNKATGAKLWNVSAHTTTVGKNPGPYRLRMHKEQFDNLDLLVGQLRRTGAPVFLGGDWNQSKGRGYWRNPRGFRSARKSGIDHIFHDPRAAKFMSGARVGRLNSDHDAWLSQFKIPSHRDGAERIRWDNTIANLHADESVLNAGQSDKFRYLADNIDKLAMAGGNQYNVNVNVTKPDANEDDIANAVVQKIQRLESRKPQRRRS